MANTPITDLVSLCDRYTADQWAHADYVAASPQVGLICAEMRLLRLQRSNLTSPSPEASAAGASAGASSPEEDGP